MCHSDDHAQTGDLPDAAAGDRWPRGRRRRRGGRPRRHTASPLGDHVAMSFVPACGTLPLVLRSGQQYICDSGRQAVRHRHDERRARGPPRHQATASAPVIGRYAQVGTFSEHILVNEDSLDQGRRRPALRRGGARVLRRGHRLRLRHRAGGHEAGRQRGRGRHRRHRHQRRAGRPRRRRPADHRHRPGRVQARAGHGARRHPCLRLHRGGDRRRSHELTWGGCAIGSSCAPASCTATWSNRASPSPQGRHARRHRPRPVPWRPTPSST